MNFHVDLDQIAKIAEIVGCVIAIDGIIKQIALKQGNTKLVSICDVVANDLNEVLLFIQAIPSFFGKAQPKLPTTITQTQTTEVTGDTQSTVTETKVSPTQGV